MPRHAAPHTPERAVVVGGGIGGMAAAAALVRTGWSVTLLERAAAFSEVGAGLAVAPNAVRALDWLGLGDELRSRGMAQGAAGLRTSSGRWLKQVSVADFGRRFGVPSFALHRADLHSMLVDAAAGCDLRTDHTVDAVTDGRDEATVCFTGPDGPGELTADLVVAADGLHSGLRGQLYPNHPGPAYAGSIAWRAVVPASAAPGAWAESAFAESWGRGHRFGVVPLAGGQVYWFATATGPPCSYRTAEPADLTRIFGGWHRPIAELLAATPADRLLRHDIYYLKEPLPSYVVGRIALLGDAAHAMTPDVGQGAAMALEDAVTLGALAPGLADYDHARRERTQELVKVSFRVGRVGQAAGLVSSSLRNLAAKLLPVGSYLRSTEKILAWEPPSAAPKPP